MEEEIGGSPTSHIPAHESIATVAPFRAWRSSQFIIAGGPIGPPLWVKLCNLNTSRIKHSILMNDIEFFFTLNLKNSGGERGIIHNILSLTSSRPAKAVLNCSLQFSQTLIRVQIPLESNILF